MISHEWNYRERCARCDCWIRSHDATLSCISDEPRKRPEPVADDYVTIAKRRVEIREAEGLSADKPVNYMHGVGGE